MKKNKGLRWLAAMLAVVCVVSCDKNSELPEERASGEEVTLQIRALEVTEGEESDFNRATSTEKKEPVLKPLDDGLLLEMTLERDEDAPLRAKKSLTEGAYFQVIAIDYTTKKYVSHALFQAGGEMKSEDLHVPLEGKYFIVCISYNDLSASSLPKFSAYTRDSDMSAVKIEGDLGNLLWWSKVLDVGAEEPAALDITLSYKVALLRVAINCEYNEWLISNVADGITVGPLSAPTSMNLITGSMSSGTAGVKAVTWSTAGMESTTFEQPSNPVAVAPKESETALVVILPKGVITRKSHPATIPTETSAYTIPFATKLLVGKNYKLIVRLRTPKWAGSNVYWEWTGTTTGYMTFAEHGVTGKEGFQGVMFKFGSLYGIPPIDYKSQSAKHSLYMPNESGGWKTRERFSSLNKPNWRAITYWDSAIYGDEVNTNAYANSSYIGDVCKYINDKYRLPKIEEYGKTATFTIWDIQNPTTTPVCGGWVKQTGSHLWLLQKDNAGESADGQYDMISNGYGHAFNQTMLIMLPTSGNMLVGELGDMSGAGTYRSNRGSNGILEFVQEGIGVGSRWSANPDPAVALPVRCVLGD
jgi:hypothetical protein